MPYHLLGSSETVHQRVKQTKVFPGLNDNKNEKKLFSRFFPKKSFPKFSRKKPKAKFHLN